MAMVIFGTAVVVINTLAAVMNFSLGSMPLGLINTSMAVFVAHIVAKDLRSR